MKVDLNADVGESYGRYTLGLDEELIPLISSANIACGFHAGDPGFRQKKYELKCKGSEGNDALPDRGGGCFPA